MKLGVSLPTFTADGDLTVRAALAAEAAELDGVFVFDHLWPLGNPGRPALSAIAALGSVAAATTHLHLGPLVARVGLRADDHLVGALTTLDVIAGPGRLIAGLGVGDHLSAAENVAYGLGFEPVARRIESLGRVASRLRAAGITVWIGGRSHALHRAAKRWSDALNSWGASAQDLAALSLPVTWGGQVLIGSDEDDLARRIERYGVRPGLVVGTVTAVAAHLAGLAAAGALWAVCAPLDIGDDPETALENLAGVQRGLALA